MALGGVGRAMSRRGAARKRPVGKPGHHSFFGCPGLSAQWRTRPCCWGSYCRPQAAHPTNAGFLTSSPWPGRRHVLPQPAHQRKRERGALQQAALPPTQCSVIKHTRTRRPPRGSGGNPLCPRHAHYAHAHTDTRRGGEGGRGVCLGAWVGG